MEHGGGVPVVGGVTADGVPLYSGIYFNPESRETTTIITTTTTTYRVFEVESDESAGEENGKEAELTINFPLECESAKYAETNGDMPEGEPFYVVIDKPQWSPRQRRREQKETGIALEKDIKPALAVSTEKTGLEERYQTQRTKDQKSEIEHADIYQQSKQFEGGTFYNAQYPVEDVVHTRLKTKLEETKEYYRRPEGREDLCETISAEIEL
uniref:Uncharacterized protein n=1 Tax=Parascaris equorum TaxID=6256 RepID=A0A914RLB5_PAREQ